MRLGGLPGKIDTTPFLDKKGKLENTGTFHYPLSLTPAPLAQGVRGGAQARGKGEKFFPSTLGNARLKIKPSLIISFGTQPAR